MSNGYQTPMQAPYMPPDWMNYYTGAQNPIGQNVDGTTMFGKPALDLTPTPPPVQDQTRQKGLFDSLFGSGDAATTTAGTAAAASGNPWASLAMAAIPGIVGGITGSQANRYNARQTREQAQRQFEYNQQLLAQKQAEDQKQLMVQLAVQQAIAQMQAGGKAAEITQGGAKVSNDSANTFLRAIQR